MIELTILAVVTTFGAYAKNLLDIHNEKTKRLSNLFLKYLIPVAIMVNAMMYAFSKQEYLIETIVVCIPCILCEKFLSGKRRSENYTAFHVLKRINISICITVLGILVFANIFYMVV